MLCLKNHLGSILASAAVLASSVPVCAQPAPVNPATTPQAPPQTSCTSGCVVPQGGGFVPPAAYPPPYPYSYQLMTPAYGYLTGASNVISSQGQFLISKRQSEVIQQQAEQAKLDTKRRSIEEWQYEQSLTPTVAQMRAKAQEEGYQDMMGNPPNARIWSGHALNTILRDVQNPGSVGSRGPSIPLDPQLISKLNFTDGTSAGNLDMFSKGAQGLEWPLALQAPNFKEDRDSITSLTADAIRQAGSAGKIEFGIITNLRSAVDRMAESLRGQVDDLTPTDYMQAKRFLQDLSKSARALGDPNAAQVLAGKWKPRAATVSELIAAMSKQGLQFAPVTPGNETAYNTAYQALRAYDTYSSQMATGPRKR